MKLNTFLIVIILIILTLFVAPTMATYTEYTDGTIGVSSEYGHPYDKEALFDHDGGTFWETLGGLAYPSFASKDFGSSPHVINNLTMTARSGLGQSMPRTFNVTVSNDGNTFTKIHGAASVAVWSNGESRSYYFSNAQSYRFYCVTFADGGYAAQVDMAELYLGLDQISAAFTANITSGTSPLTVQFTDTSTNTPTSWSWDFGDSQTSTEQNPSHTFTSAGVYSVSLTAANTGGSDTIVKSNYITVQSPTPTSGVVSISSGYINQPGENTTLTLRLDNASNGLGGYNVNVSVSNPSVAQITSVSYPLWASSMNTTSPLPATQNVLIKASDVNHLVETNAMNIELATITVSGLSPGETSLVLSSTNVDDDDGLDISHTLTNGDLTVDYPLTDPEIYDITPSSGYTNGSVMVVLNGTGFRSGVTTVKLTSSNQSDIIGTSVAFVSRHRVDCTFDLTGKQPGAWNVTLTNTDDKTATLMNGFTLVRPLVPVTGMISLPADLDLDGLTEDINHNGQKDYADVNTFFGAFEWIVENEPVAVFDFNGTGTLGYGDIVALFDMIS